MQIWKEIKFAIGERLGLINPPVLATVAFSIGFVVGSWLF